MINLSQVNRRNVVASCLAFSLLILPSLASGQGLLGTPESSGIKVETEGRPATQEPAVVVTLPGGIPENAGSTTKDGAGSMTKDGAGSMTKDGAGSMTKDGAGSMTKDGAGSATKEGPAGAETELSAEEQRAAWMAELKQLTFAQLVKRIRYDEQKINKLYINIPLGYLGKQRAFQNEIKALQNEVVELNRLLEPAAIEAFRSDPAGSRAVTIKVFEVLASKLSPQGRNSKYDPKEGLRLVDTILEIKGGDIGVEPGVSPLPEDEPFINVIWQGYLASYGLQDFERANTFLTRLENMDIGLDPDMRKVFEATAEDWEKEKSIRAEEARADNLPRVKLETTDGDVLIELFENEAPNTVANFIKLTQEGYYDGLEFFQVVPSLYARSGCKANDGTTHPGYRIRNEFENIRSHFAGTVVMQNDGENTAGSQFIILHRPDPNLKEKVVSFGRVIEGLENIYGFKTVNRIRNAGGEATIINKATVVRGPIREHELETIDASLGLSFEDGNNLLPGGLSPRSPNGSSSRPQPTSSPTTLPPTGYSTRPVVPTSPPSRSSGSSTRPSGSSTRPSGSSTRPSGSSTQPSGLPVRPSRSSARTSGSSARPSGLPVRPNRSPTRSNGSSTRSSGSSTRP